MNWWHYLLLVNIYLVLFYGFYALLLRKETFFQLNRLYLVAAALLSFLIPMIQSEWVKSLFITEQVRYSIYGGSLSIYSFKPVESSPITIGEVLTVLYLAGIVFLTIRFAFQLISVNRIIKGPAPSAAYSFFKKISLGENPVKQDVILAHEQVHASQWHSVDVLLIETVMIINWFNPIVYLYRFAIKHTHEFIADQQAIKVGVDKTEYALLLLSQTFSAPSHQLVNPFYNHSLLKKRIQMLQKNKSQRIVLFKYILSAPLFGLMLILSSATINNSKAIATIHTKADNVFSESAVATITGIADHGEIPEQMDDETTTASSTATENYQVQGILQDKVYEEVDKVPSFPGGPNAFFKFLSRTVKYPVVDRKNNITGKVIITFVVERDGSLTNIRAVRGPSPTTMSEAVRTMRTSPKWTPGELKGKKVRAAYTIPVNFTLESDKPNTASKSNNTPHEDIPPQSVYANGAQQSANKVYDNVEKEPEFPGGPDAFNKFIAEHVHYPAVDRDNKITGKVIVQFIVERDGSVTDVRAVRAPSPTTGAEAVRVMKLLPNWKPGLMSGKPVRVSYTVPVNFTLNNNNAPSNNNTPREEPPPIKNRGVTGNQSQSANVIYDNVDKEPSFTGGPDAFNKFLSQTVKYPAIDRENNTTGKVIVQFIVEKDGSLSDVKAVRGPSPTTMEAAVKAMQVSPKWNPGVQNGHIVRVSYTIPVNFVLSSDETVINRTADFKTALTNQDPSKRPLILLDGVEVSDIRSVNQNTISSIDVLKEPAATEKYGKKAANGVIIITSKDAAAKKGFKDN